MNVTLYRAGYAASGVVDVTAGRPSLQKGEKMEDIRFGIIGTGNIASKFAEACALTPGVAAAGISSRREESGQRFARENGVEHVFIGAEALVSSPEIDIVYVATPHTNHFEHCMLALRAGKHVLCEKPMTVSRREAELLFAEAKERNLFLMEGMWTRFLPNSLRALDWIREGRIGKVRFIDGIFSFAVDPKAPKRRLVDPACGGGATFDLGVYMVEMASYYAGADPLRWDGFVTEYCPGTDAAAVIAAEYPDQILATLRMGITCEAPAEMTIIGEKGRIELPRFFVASEVRLYEGETLAEKCVTDCELPKGFCYEIAAVRDYLRAGVTESPVVPQTATIATAEILREMMHRAFPAYY